MSIFDLITSQELAAYWELTEDSRNPYMFEELFPNEQKLGIDLSWLKGKDGLPVVLKPSAFDVEAIPRPRIGVEKLSAEMPFFKESKYIDETLRQELNKVLASGNQVYIDTIINRIFADEMDLLNGAAAQRERMRAMMVTTGVISIVGNGQAYEYDYGMPAEHKVTVGTSWSDPAASIMSDIQKGIQTIEEDTGVRVTRAVCSSKIYGYMRANAEIKATLLNASDGVGFITDERIRQYLQDQFQLQVVTNDYRYKDEQGDVQRYVPEDVFVLLPSGTLGNTWFGTTPEQSDLMASAAANVSIVDTGVAVTTITKADPVNVETKVTQICLPDFPTADQVYILDVVA